MQARQNPKPITTTTVVKEPLSPKRIELAALALIEEIGLAAFSTRKLGTKLGCEAMSIYNHFPSKAHLFDALVDRVMSSVDIPPRDIDSIVRIRILAQGWREMAKRHRCFFPVLAVHRFDSEVGMQYLNEILSTLHSAGLDTESAYRAYRVIAHYLMGATLEEISGYDTESLALNPISQQALIQKFPQVAAVQPYYTKEYFDVTFEFGLNALLKGVGLLNS